jgi:hypothetical protein
MSNGYSRWSGWHVPGFYLGLAVIFGWGVYALLRKKRA